jgi:hypothetical protein
VEASISIEGGIAHFPGLARERRVDFSTLRDTEIETFRALVEKARFFARQDAPAGGGADRRTYRIAIDLGGGRKMLTVRDPVNDPDLAALIRFIEAHAR